MSADIFLRERVSTEYDTNITPMCVYNIKILHIYLHKILKRERNFNSDYS